MPMITKVLAFRYHGIRRISGSHHR
ncbi:hypothetical protein ID866_3797 [Astraeus odoratus]|nr:hypothetical protein ID866_3797 [Astraeus odoratus]